tara:strand:- start:97 stop:450 length:354 start_codon:yes stop_codon:yes gene_type:complete
MAMASDEVRSDSDFVRSFMFSQPNILRLSTVEEDPQLKQIQDEISELRDEKISHDVWEVEPGVNYDKLFGIRILRLRPIDNGRLELTVHIGGGNGFMFRVDAEGVVEDVNDDVMDMV